ncbi:acyl-homoserine-lactone synthase [Devosia sp. A369]
MRLVAVQNPGGGETSNLIEQMHRLRARVFRERLGWDVAVTGHREIDEYDALDPVYVLVISNTGRVIGCARLLPGCGPTMLGRTFPVLLDGVPVPSSGQIIESSRFCIDTEVSGTNTARGLHQATMMLFAGILDWAMAHGHSQVMTVTDLRFERILKRAGLPFTRLGTPHLIGSTMAVAGTVPATQATVSSVRLAGQEPLCNALNAA